MNVADLKTVHPLDAGKKYQEYQKKGAEIGEIALHDKQGRLKIAQYHAIRIKKDFNVSVLADITARKNNEKALEEAKARAEESDRLKTAFLANMSHEIRTPMNSILGFTELLKKTNLSEAKQRKFIETISKSGKRMLNTINDLIDISRIEAGQIEVTWSEVHINALMQEMKTLFEPEAAQKGLQLQYIKALPAGKEVVSTDKEKLYHILKNLVNNGIKYTNAGYVTFGVDDQYQQLRFYVEDTGIGIAKDKQQVIFERFVQEDINLSRPYEGAGLGLSIIKAYVDMLGGKIWVESEKQQGSCFYFTLPRQ